MKTAVLIPITVRLVLIVLRPLNFVFGSICRVHQCMGANGMGMTGNSPGTTIPTCIRLALLLLMMAGIGCSSMPPARVEPPLIKEAIRPSTSDVRPEVDARRGEFTAAVSMLDTWNAVGQILVRLDGVTYEGRAQMLGIYSVRYRDERFLILTRALVQQGNARGMVTKIGAILLDGKPNESAAALELLELLQQRLPAELALISAGGRGRVRP